MKPTTIIFASAVLAFAATAPGNAQKHDAMKHSSMGMKMSAADMNMMMSCKRMSKTAMMKNKTLLKHDGDAPEHDGYVGCGHEKNVGLYEDVR